MDGLQQPLVVTPEENGRYKVLSGHRRRAAIRLLLEESEDPLPKLRSVPCLVRRYKSRHLAELQLILANSTARELTSAEKMRQAERIEMLLYQLKEEGYQFPGRMRDQVAAACNVSAPKLARLKVIREHLIPEYMVAFEANRLPEQTAYALAHGSQAEDGSWTLTVPVYAAGSLYERFCVSVSREGDTYSAKVVQRGREDGGEPQ